MFYAGIAVLALGIAFYKYVPRKWKADKKPTIPDLPKKPEVVTDDYKLCPHCGTKAHFEFGLCLNCGSRDED